MAHPACAASRAPRDGQAASPRQGPLITLEAPCEAAAPCGRPRVAGALGLLGAISLVAAAHAGTTTALTLPAGPYPGSQARQYKVYVPDTVTQPAAMVMALHGCQQTHDDVLRDWGLTAAADRHGFVLVAPFITRYDGVRNNHCWGFWMEQHRHEAAGEPEDLHRIALAVEARWPIDASRRFIAGLSSGGAMAVVGAVTHNEYWAAVASASGLAYGEGASAVSLAPCPGNARQRPSAAAARDMRRELDHPYAVPLLVLQNERDCTVLQSAARALRDAHLLAFGAPGRDTPGTTEARRTTCKPVFLSDLGCEQTYHTTDATVGARSIVETVFYRGPIPTANPSDTDRGHYWIGGEAGAEGRWAVQAGPSYPEIIWEFFARHPRSAAGTEVAPEPPGAVPPPAAACASVRTLVLTHVNAGRAESTGWLGLRAVATGDGRDIGFTWGVWPLVTLWDDGAGRWFARRPANCAPGGRPAADAAAAAKRPS